MTGASWMSLLWFVVVLALIPLALWLLRRSGLAGAASGPASAGPRLTGSLMLGPQQRVVTVEVGEGAERRWLVLGVTAQQITTLHTLSQPPQAATTAGTSNGRAAGRQAGAGQAVSAPSGFAQVLARVMAGSRRSTRVGRPAAPVPPRSPQPSPGVPQRRQEHGSDHHVD